MEENSEALYRVGQSVPVPSQLCPSPVRRIATAKSITCSDLAHPEHELSATPVVTQEPFHKYATIEKSSISVSLDPITASAVTAQHFETSGSKMTIKVLKPSSHTHSIIKMGQRNIIEGSQDVENTLDLDLEPCQENNPEAPQGFGKILVQKLQEMDAHAKGEMKETKDRQVTSETSESTLKAQRADIAKSNNKQVASRGSRAKAL